ncbi:glycoside hydrolase family 35 protein [Pseudocercospora fijiensis CIRAD86]|uniref:Beta-galactosidase n=1 Tax=Pseudocercospora fijiensis (strain CIRAD86) TaxID=383855 RepID=M3ASL6_PSEFD|nr:glycoside hydrolase family 35 protein [Pseudocercospora fijiensis CIRAD86]EME80492.1 glycoside hydrolase family 35 protein [Pseudocercospora fijiensis CIRAD86]
MAIRSLTCISLLCLAASLPSVLALHAKPNQVIRPYKREPLQDIVTWDEHSLFVHRQRVLFFSGEFHPFRLPSPSLWLDILQKIKALGYNAVSAYWDWALVEGKPGHYLAEGAFAVEPFLEAAQKAGLYVLARPGPYINAEVSGGGFPGWLQRNPGKLRTRDQNYLDATDNYLSHIGRAIARYQITNGGPVILLQPENEFSPYPELPDPVYWNHVEHQYRNAGIVVPFINNDSPPYGYFAPGPPQRFNAVVDIYGHDGYPVGFDCANPDQWLDARLPSDWGDLHQKQSPSTPYSLVEFQGGSFDPWGGSGFINCSKLTGPEFQRVFNKNNYGFGVTIFNTYMAYGGTNWGNLGFPEGYASYDYGAVISEDGLIDREKYSELKLQANFLQASPAYLSATPQSNHNANGSYTGDETIAVTALVGNATSFFVVRHAAYNSLTTGRFTIKLPTTKGNVTIPQLGEHVSLSLHGRDSKIYVTDYDVGGINLLYSTAEIFTWKQYGDRRVLVVYGGPGETNELALIGGGQTRVTEGAGILSESRNGSIVLQFPSSSARRIIELDSCNLTLYILDRASAYKSWVVDSSPMPALTSPIIQGPYLVRTYTIHGTAFHLTGDVDSDTTIEILGGAPHPLTVLTWNGISVSFNQSRSGVVKAILPFSKPIYSLPDLSSANWKVTNSLPELSPSYDDALWPSASLNYTNNTSIRNLTTPTSLYSADYGFHSGHFLYRGHFTSNGNESTFFVHLQGGSAFAYSVFLNSTFIASYSGTAGVGEYNETYTLPKLVEGKEYVITILMAMMGYTENQDLGIDYPSEMKAPRGILDYDLAGRTKDVVNWKITGNNGGEDYLDKSRGPLNEGGLWAERQGFHLPGAPLDRWADGKPQDGLKEAGVAFHCTDVDLSMPQGYAIPIALSFGNSTAVAYQAQVWVNGWQFGRYINHIGPQKVFPVPEGIWKYRGSNRVCVSLWALESKGARIEDLRLVAGKEIQSGFGEVEMAPGSSWALRSGAY